MLQTQNLVGPKILLSSTSFHSITASCLSLYFHNCMFFACRFLQNWITFSLSSTQTHSFFWFLSLLSRLSYKTILNLPHMVMLKYCISYALKITCILVTWLTVFFFLFRHHVWTAAANILQNQTLTEDRSRFTKLIRLSHTVQHYIVSQLKQRP